MHADKAETRASGNCRGLFQEEKESMRRRFLHEGCLEPGKPSGLSRGTPKPSSEHADGKILLLCPKPVNAHFWCMSFHIRNVPGLSTIEMSPGYHAGEKAGVFIFCQPCLQG